MKAAKAQNVLKLCTLTFVILVATGCVHRTPPVKFVSMQNWRKVAVIQEMIIPPNLPEVPLIQAGIYRGKVLAVAADLIRLHQECIDGYEGTLGEQLAENFGFEVLHGKQLLDQDVFKNIESSGIKKYSTTCRGDGFNTITVPSRGYNFFDFGRLNGNPYVVFFGRNNGFLGAHAESLAAICRALDVDSVVVAAVVVQTTSISFVTKGSKRLVLRLTFFDRSGKVFYSNVASTRREESWGDDLDAYRNMLEKYPEVVRSLCKRIVGVKKSVTSAGQVEE